MLPSPLPRDLAGGRPTRGAVLTLVGFRASGKSTVGRLLAARLGRSFVDLDAEVERRLGRTIASLFAEQGEAAFRDAESETLAEVAAAAPGVVLATGGGVVLRAENRRILRDLGLVAWLRADAATLAARLAADPGGRPTLTGRGLVEEVAEVLAARRALYAEVADMTLDVDAATPEAVAEAIATRVAPPVSSGEGGA